MYEQLRRKLRICLHLLRKSLAKTFIFSEVLAGTFIKIKAKLLFHCDFSKNWGGVSFFRYLPILFNLSNVTKTSLKLFMSWYFVTVAPSLRKTCLYLEFFWSAFSRIRTEYREIQSISPYSVRMQENTDQ